MRIIKQGQQKTFADTTQANIEKAVADALQNVRDNGDAAVRELSEKFDGWTPESFRLTDEQIAGYIAELDEQTLEDLHTVQNNVHRFAEAQLATMQDLEVETQPGVFLGHRHVPIAATGAYIPGGRYPMMASAHMTIITAKAAGVQRVVACTPPIHGEVPAATVAAAHFAGADEIYVLGGVQAIAAMAIGTPSIEPVNMIAGPGNAFVAEAKRQMFGEIGIDLFAGPTEVLIVADDTADPLTVAVDLLSQAEHGPESPAVLVTTSDRVARQTVENIEKLLPGMPTGDTAGQAWRDYGQIIVCDGEEEMWEVSNGFASEHVQIFTAEPRDALDRMHDYGALFLGEGTCVAYGDKVIGTNHVLPTLGAARYTGGLWVGKFLKTCTFQEVRDNDASGELGRLCGRAARVENFDGHGRSGDLRAAKALGDSFDWLENVDVHA
ncbi:Histidinol dehydrogenase 1 [Corynebacterium glyciniphilum AJ 3170]|uniref:Histidinol dehydrogenase n=1 Tax=Corynebacterium glyciniphilum AJ 3170 TaxID=1404245 RepID=X5ED99_9CORY|nr:histidinol dehydrogenase [Corynebacterium glyciniphilum]AHW64606.1 Histidinol dehydrogenase 1 [Corynebacterium glyciniphilum AJ 3170]